MITILKKREGFRRAFDDFSIEKIVRYDEVKVNELLGNEAIIRSRGKIAAAISNAAIFQDIQREFGAFSAYLWGFTDGKVIQNTDDKFYTKTDLSDKISKDLKGRGMKYVGSVTIYSFLQAIGVVKDHELACFRYSC